MPDRASLTAEYMALFRALESLRPAGSRLFDDPFAAIFLQDQRLSFYRLARWDLGRRLVERLLNWKAPGARAAGIARTKWIDDKAAKALQSATQLVLLGAGFDARAYRLASARRCTAFELDRPETSLAKQAALKKALGSLPSGVRFLGVDFNRQPMGEVLLQAGFDPGRPACFVWEGVTHYLSAESVDGMLRQISQAASGSVLLFTYIHRKALEKPYEFFRMEEMMSRVKSYGVPWTFGLCPEDLAAYLAARGLRLMEDWSVADIWRRTGRPPSEIRGYEFYRVASARVGN